MRSSMPRPPVRTPSLVLAFIAAGVLGGCGGNDRLSGLIKVDGSSTVFPVTARAAEAYMATAPGVRIAVGVSGTGGGFGKFVRREIDISNASRPIKAGEVEKAEAAGIGFIELPVAYDGLVVAVNPGATWVDCLSVEELKRMWEPGSDIDNWRDVRPGFPDVALRLYGAGTDSGTYDYFTAAIVGEEGTSRADFTASEDDNVLVQGVAGDRSALGFFGLAYLENNVGRIKAVGIRQEEGGACVKPSLATVEDGTYQPLARPEFIYVRADRAADPVVAGFVTYYLQHGRTLAPAAGYVPLSEEAYALSLDRFRRGTTGTAFKGSAVGVKLADLLRSQQAGADAASDADSARLPGPALSPDSARRLP